MTGQEAIDINWRAEKYWKKLSTEAVELPSLEVFKTRQDSFLSSVLDDHDLNKRVEQGNSQKASPTSTILWLCSSIICADTTNLNSLFR